MSESTRLSIPNRSRLRVSVEDFWRICRANPDLRPSRSPRGGLRIKPPAGSDSGRRNASLTAPLWNWNRAAGLGHVFDSSSGFALPDGLIHAPDAAWIARTRWEALTPAQRSRFAPICPDFVAELRSPSDSLADLYARLASFVRQGARLGWLLDTKRQVVEVFRPVRPVEALNRPDRLSGEDVLPGFLLDLDDILT